MCFICPQDDGILNYDLEPGLHTPGSAAEQQTAATTGRRNHRRQPLAGKSAQREIPYGRRTVAIGLGGRADHADQHQTSGQRYITLRDDYQDIALEVNGFGQFAAAATPFVQGDRVIIHGKPNLWMKRTSLSLRGDAIIAAGAGGSLKAMIDELRKKLKGEGLFDADRKQPLPEFPHCIGLICAPQVAPKAMSSPT